MRTQTFRAGDPVVCRVTKHSTSPGPRAINIDPAPHGETYTYQVDKYWLVDDATLMVKTRRGRTRLVPIDDPNLRRANWWERVVRRDRFPTHDAQEPRALS